MISIARRNDARSRMPHLPKIADKRSPPVPPLRTTVGTIRHGNHLENEKACTFLVRSEAAFWGVLFKCFFVLAPTVPRFEGTILAFLLETSALA